ncbi:uncharacterized protein ATC70_000189 [Mucor velutinosus]|uniref:Uncharacterized protein n=1 Tax=Mucor velutinosus TaxID=708070 RepID=A0AAN7I0Y7_9FUNG|nr:hypothetical protein ATC70_000189 [Mucor velutinosus]
MKTDDSATTTTAEAEPTPKDTITQNSTSPPAEKLSLAHYILVTPFAAFYIVGRALFDTIRYSIYWFLWSCERTIPHLDDWLFDFVTVSVPRAYNATEHWWTDHGKPACQRYATYTQQHIIPNTVHGLEVFFVGTYRVGCAIQTVTMEFVNAWRRFVDRHDWHQLAMDLSHVAYKTCWVPTAWLVTRTTRLCKITYSGLRAMVISIGNDVHWTCTVAIPYVYNYITSTRVAQWVGHGSVIVWKGVEKSGVWISDHVLAPTIGRLLTFLVRSIDSLILLLQQRTIQEKVERLYRLVAPHVVWACMDSVAIANDMLSGSYHAYKELIMPTYALFMKHIVPRLTIAYKAAATNLVEWHNTHLYPAWLVIYPYLNVPLLWIYTNLTLPVYREMYALIATMTHYMTQYLSAQLWTLGTKLVDTSAAYATSVYSFIQYWLLKQAPVLAAFIQSSYERATQLCDWQALYQDSLAVVATTYDWVSRQSNAMYASLERSLGAWADEQQQQQQQQGQDQALSKKQKIQ